jgi:hypothetical protein
MYAGDGMKANTILLGVALVLGMAFVPTAAADHDPDDDEIGIDASGPFQETQEVCFPLFPGAHVQEEERVNESQRVYVEGFGTSVGGEEVFVPGVTVVIGDDATEVGGFWVELDEKNVTVDDVDETIGIDQTVGIDQVLPGVSVCVEYAQI